MDSFQYFIRYMVGALKMTGHEIARRENVKQETSSKAANI